MTKSAKKYYTPEEYLALEETATYKSEYYKGEIFMMAGGSVRHNLISSNVNAELNMALRKRPCSVFSSDMRLLINKNGLYTYPDVMVVCGNVELMKGRTDTLTNPTLIIEVLSPATRNYDRKGKFKLYQALPAMQDYLLIDQEQVYIECYHRTGQRTWNLETFENLEEVINLESIGVTIPLSGIYDKIEFDLTT